MCGQANCLSVAVRVQRRGHIPMGTMRCDASGGNLGRQAQGMGAGADASGACPIADCSSPLKLTADSSAVAQWR